MMTRTAKALLKEVSSVTGSKYDLNDRYVLETALEELFNCYAELEDKFIEYDNKINEEYKPKVVDYYYEYGVNENDFH